MRTKSRRNPRRQRRESAVGFKQLPWQTVVNPYSPTDVLSTEQIELIHQASLQILEDIGVDFLLPEALSILRAAGLDVQTNIPRVRFDRGIH